jgi:release factor glutamine methyltransferase
VDIGTGSGCIAIALAKELPAATVYATDISRPALDVARRNAGRHGFSGRIQFIESNILENFSKPGGPGASPQFDLIISNPPYIGLLEAATLPIEVREHEPQSALFGGEEGYELYGALILQSAQRLKPGGLLVLELGHNSLAAVEPLLDPSQWTNTSVTNDLAGIPRVLSAARSGAPRLP